MAFVNVDHDSSTHQIGKPKRHPIDEQEAKLFKGSSRRQPERQRDDMKAFYESDSIRKRN